MILYPVIFIILIGLVLRYTSLLRTRGLHPWTMSAAFLVKFLIGLSLFAIHIKTYGIDELSHDGETFFKEGKLLYNVFFQSPLDYLKLLTGIGENDQLIRKYLYMTEYWSAGDLSLVNDSKNVIRVHSLIHFFSGNSVFIHLAVMCVVSLAGVRNLYLTFRPYIKQNRHLVFWFFLLIPSTIFWTSSIMKEPMMFFGITLMVRALVREKLINRKAVFLFISLILLLAFKPYVLACSILALACLAIYKYLFRHRLWPSLLFVLGATFAGVFLLEKPTGTVVHYLTRKQFDFVNVGKGGLHVKSDSCFYYFKPHQYPKLFIHGSEVKLLEETDAYIIHFGSIQQPIPVHLEPGNETWTLVYKAVGCASYIETTPIENSVKQLLLNIPEALTNAVIRPFFNDPGSALKYLSFAEVWLIFLFIVFAIIKRRPLRKKEKEMIFVLIAFWLFLSLLIGWTTPVLGAISRYRFPAQLSIITAGLILLKPLNWKLWKNTY